MLHFFYNIATSYPETVAVALGLIFAIGTTQTFTLVWFPSTWTPREWMKVVSILDFLLASIFSAELWRLLDHDRDSHGLIFVSSLGVGLCAFLIHMLVLRIVRKRWPWLQKDLPNE